MLLGPTHEEMFTLLVKDLYSSYKDLPLSLYQIQTKYRDEARPRAGILRGREFVMKDSYSFDIDDAGLEASYQAHREAYVRIFDRLGFEYVIVQADSGAMGGSASEEFLAVAETGEDTFVRSPGGYAANVEAVTTVVPEPLPYDDVPAAHAEQTPETPTIETLVDHLNVAFPRDDRAWEAADTLKNVLVILRHPDGTREPLAIGLPGDRDVDVRRLEAQVAPAEVEAFTDDDFAAHPDLVKGYIGPGALGEKQVDRHPLPGRSPGRHRHPLGDRRRRRRIARLRPRRRPRLHAGRHDRGGRGACRRPGARRLRTAGARPRHRDGPHLPARPQVRRGARAPGARRERQARHGHDGLVRRRASRAPSPPSSRTPTTSWASCGHARSRRSTSTSSPPARTTRRSTPPTRWSPSSRPTAVEVLYDDRRKESPGVKFKDAELLGMPTIVVVGKGLADGVVEVRDRATGERIDVPVGEAAEHLRGICR